MEAKGNCTAVIVSLNLFLCSEHFSFSKSQQLKLVRTGVYGYLESGVFQARPKDPDCTAAGLIRAALRGDNMGGSVNLTM